MKKLFFALLLAVSIAGSAFAAIGVKKVNAAIVNNFKSEFKKASGVTWKTEADYVKATFTLNNKQMEVFYNVDGEVIGTSHHVSPDELPVKAKRTFAQKFDGYEVKEAISFEGTAEDAYYISAENEKEAVIVKVSADQSLSIFKRVKK